MTELDRAMTSELAVVRPHHPRLNVGLTDVVLSLVTFAASFAALAYASSALAGFAMFVLLHLAVLIVPLIFLLMRARGNGELTIPVLLLVATFAAGPVGALGCAMMALALRQQRPSPRRLQHWYDYIAGVVARSRVARIHGELASGRLSSDPNATVPRFGPILHGASVEEQQRVLGVIGRRYHADFRAALRRAMRNKNGFIRAQAAAVASRLDVNEKNRLWSTGMAREAAGEGANALPDQGARAPDPGALDVEPRRP
jgi:hypothetical protein